MLGQQGRKVGDGLSRLLPGPAGDKGTVSDAQLARNDQPRPSLDHRRIRAYRLGRHSSILPHRLGAGRSSLTAGGLPPVSQLR